MGSDTNSSLLFQTNHCSSCCRLTGAAAGSNDGIAREVSWFATRCSHELQDCVKTDNSLFVCMPEEPWRNRGPTGRSGLSGQCRDFR